MNRIYEFIENDTKKLEIFKFLDGFVFYDGYVWMFPNSNKDFIYKVVSDIISVDNFIKLGNKLADNLNKMNIDVLDYDVDKIEEYLNI